MTEVSVVIPTKNEEKSIGICVEKIQKVFKDNHIDGEIIVADNSTDRTAEIAKSMGAKVIVPDKHGYGYAYWFGFEHASGDYVVMGDGDNTYDFTDIPRLLEPLKRGEADLVLGSRFKGEIKKGAMPWHHQYIGNPVLTWLFNKANKSNINDTHSGFRAFTREAYEKIKSNLKATGMEFAIEMLKVAIIKDLRIAEVPITYYPRESGSKPNLNWISDGWRHLKHILLRAPTLLFLIPGFILFAFGILVVLLIWAPFNLWEFRLGIHSMIAGCLLALVGYQIILFGLFAKVYGVHHGMEKRDGITEFISTHITLGRGATVGLMLFLAGFIFTLRLLLNWIESG
ncbi:MAG: glycosyltransferase family 2 protein [archaeon]|nr:glycosyltransferase family 2 protein [archaeon]